VGKSKIVAALYAGLMGITILGMWTMLLATGQAPELATAPLRFTFHLVAELLTAVVCIVAGYGVFSGRAWGVPAYLVAGGLLLYAVAQAAGYYLQQGDSGFTTLFLVFIVFTLGVLWRLMKSYGWHPVLVFLGMVLYATVQTIGYFAQAGELVATLMFVVLVGCTLVSTFALAKPEMAAVQTSR
jgi:hypothetical protein